MTELPSWTADGHAAPLRPPPRRARRRGPTATGPDTGWAGRRRPRKPSSSWARRSSAAAAAGSCTGSMAAPNSRSRVGRAVRRPASRCRRGRWPRRRRGRRGPRSTAPPTGRARPGRCPRRPCRPAGPPGPTRPAWASSRGRNVAGSQKRAPGVASVPSGTARISVSPTTTCS